MEPIKQLLELDMIQWFYTGIIILSGIVALLTLVSKFCDYIDKPIKWLKGQNDDHELIMRTRNDLDCLIKDYKESVNQSIRHDDIIKRDLSDLALEIKNALATMQDDQKEIAETVRQIALSNETRDNATMEEMCDRISQKSRHYINDLHGIPEDEYDDFVRLFKAYQGIHGNHGAEAKYNYCMKHLPILPVETKVKE